MCVSVAAHSSFWLVLLTYENFMGLHIDWRVFVEAGERENGAERICTIMPHTLHKSNSPDT